MKKLVILLTIMLSLYVVNASAEEKNNKLEWQKISPERRIIILADGSAEFSVMLYKILDQSDRLVHNFKDYGINLEGYIPTEIFYISISLLAQFGGREEQYAEWEENLVKELLAMKYILENPDILSFRPKSYRIK